MDIDTALPGPDGNSSDNWNSDPREDRGDDGAMEYSTVKKSIRVLF